MADLSGLVVLVTGSASGIGCATAKRCAQAGATVVATDIADVEVIASESGINQDHCYSLDVSQEPSAKEAVAAILSRVGKIDGLVNCAGITGSGSVHSMEKKDWDRVLQINLTGSMLLCKYVIADMITQGIAGSVVNLASVYGMTGGPGSLPYNVSKGAVLQMTRSLAADYGRLGIRVNSVSPGYIDTPMSSMVKISEEFYKKFVSMHLLQRPGQPEEVAKAIEFLLSDDASYITGVNLPVDGGFSSSHIPTV